MPTFGVLGSGEVGQALAAGSAASGTRCESAAGIPEVAGYATETGISGTSEVARWGEAWCSGGEGTAAENACAQAGTEQLRGKIVIDTTNPLGDEPPRERACCGTSPAPTNR